MGENTNTVRCKQGNTDTRFRKSETKGNSIDFVKVNISELLRGITALNFQRAKKKKKTGIHIIDIPSAEYMLAL
jgi:hypothetical protein